MAITNTVGNRGKVRMMYKGVTSDPMLLNESPMLFRTHDKGPMKFEEFRRILQTVEDV